MRIISGSPIVAVSFPTEDGYNGGAVPIRIFFYKHAGVLADIVLETWGGSWANNEGQRTDSLCSADWSRHACLAVRP